MSLRKTAAFFAAFVVIATLANQARAQREIHHIPPWVSPNGANPDFAQPFIDGPFTNDYRIFAPAEFGEFGRGLDLHTGWFASYDRVHIYMSRPDQESTSTEGDFTWGNRFSFGYMTEEDHGWFGEFWHIDGPNYFAIVEAERVNVLEPDDEINGDPDNIDLRGGGGGGGQQQQQQPNPQRNGLPVSDRNNPVSQDRRYFLHDSINAADLTSFELNKSVRWKPLHYNSIVEPFVGFRYMKYQDFHRRDTYSRIDDMGVVVGQVPPFTQDPTLLQNELFTSLDSHIDNHMVGGQFGLRWYKHKSRWNLSSEIRAFLLQNFQFHETFQFTELTFYDSTGVDEEPEGVFIDRQRISTGNATEFVFGGEVRAEAAYEVTRDLSLKMGMTFMEFGAGIARGNSLDFNRQNVTMVGVTGGIVYRR